MSRRGLWKVVASCAAFAVCGCPSSSSEPGGDPPGDERPTTGSEDREPAKAPPRAEPEKAPTPRAEPAEPAPPAGDESAPSEEPAPAAEDTSAAEEAAAAPSGGTIPSGGVEIIEREGLRVLRLVLARNVEDREPVDPGARFSSAGGGRVYAFIEVDNPERTESELTIAWVSAESSEERGATTVQVGAMPRWRTWAFTNVSRHRGAMEAVVRDGSGNLLARAPFEITE